MTDPGKQTDRKPGASGSQADLDRLVDRLTDRMIQVRRRQRWGRRLKRFAMCLLILLLLAAAAFAAAWQYPEQVPRPVKELCTWLGIELPDAMKR